MKTLAMMKMEKNFIAHIEKHYPRKPYEQFSTIFLFKRLKDECDELALALKCYNLEGAMEECADVSNVVDYIFERLSRGLIL